MLEKNVYSVAFRLNILYVFVKSICSNMYFKSNILLLIFCLDDLSIVDSGVLKSPTVTELLSVWHGVSSTGVCWSLI